MEQKTCPICNTVFNKPPKSSKQQWGRRFCCSKKCAAKHRGAPWLEKFKMKTGSTLGEKTRFKKGELSGKNNPLWKGKNASYTAKHIWIAYNFGKPQFCEICKTSAKVKYQWANISGKHKRDRNDWLRLCIPCHHKYDNPSHEQKTFYK